MKSIVGVADIAFGEVSGVDSLAVGGRGHTGLGVNVH